MFALVLYLFAVLVVVVVRLWVILPGRPNKKIKRRDTNGFCKLAVFLGSGGHTTEALALLSGVSFHHYKPRTYFVSEGDIFSKRKAEEFERTKEESESEYIKDYNVVTIPRARKVHQSLLMAIPAALQSFRHTLYYFTYLSLVGSPIADVLILNGPGTCFVLCIAVYISKFCGLPAPKLIYVESFARVNRLSLSGKLLRPLVDRFIVQWPELLQDGGRGECHGWLV